MPIPLNQVRVAEIVLRGQIAAGGSDAVNTAFVFHYRRTAVTVDPAKAALNNAFTAGPAAAIAAALNVSWEASLHDIRWLNDAEDPYLSVTATEIGAIAGDRLPSDDAVFLLFRTALRGRRFKGGKHLAPFSESDIGNDVLNAGAITRCTTICTALGTPLTDSTGNVWNFTIVSRFLSQLRTNPTTVVSNDVTQLLVNHRIGTMLSRKVRSVY
jgi:hypothetical protein